MACARGRRGRIKEKIRREAERGNGNESIRNAGTRQIGVIRSNVGKEEKYEGLRDKRVNCHSE